MFPGMLMQIVDPVILSEEGAYASNFQSGLNTMEHINSVMFSVTKLVLSCSKQAPTERMRMSDAAAEMRRIRHRHVKTRQTEEDPMPDAGLLAKYRKPLHQFSFLAVLASHRI
jgi:hypothetical protein